jgi:hypothetical protein
MEICNEIGMEMEEIDDLMKELMNNEESVMEICIELDRNGHIRECQSP